MKPVYVKLSPEAEEIYKKLVTSNLKIEKSILNSINKKKELIKINIHYGEPIAKNKFPLEYRQRYGITNLFWIELSNFWRMLYTLTNDGGEREVIVVVLDILDHRRYNKKFGYKRN